MREIAARRRAPIVDAAGEDVALGVDRERGTAVKRKTLANGLEAQKCTVSEKHDEALGVDSEALVVLAVHTHVLGRLREAARPATCAVGGDGFL